MKQTLCAAVTLLLSISSFAQGSVIFNNRTQAGDRPITYGADANQGFGLGTLPGATAQLVLVTGAAGLEIFTPLTPTTPFRTGNAAAFFTEIRPFVVQGVQPGESARFVVRAWAGAASFDEARESGLWLQSPIFTVDALGGTPPGGGLPIATPTLDNLSAIHLVIPEPSTLALGFLGAAVLLFRWKR